MISYEPRDLVICFRDVPFETITKMEKWAHSNCQGKWFSNLGKDNDDYGCYFFHLRDDYLAFKLRWL